MNYSNNYTPHRFSAAAYIRLSREDGDKLESDSVKNQKSFIERFLQNSPEINVKDYFVDDGFTGTNFDRPAFKDMIGAIESGIVDCVIVKDLSRFGRDYIETGRYLERVFPRHHVRFIAITDGIDNLNQRYDISMPIKNIVNAQYAEDISKKVMAAISTKQKNGQFIGAFSSYGYIKDPQNKNKLIVDEVAAEIVRRIYSMFVGGIGTQTIARRLNKEGIPCPSVYKRMNGLKYRNSNKLSKTDYWTYSTIRCILKKQLYIGDMVQHITNASRYNYDGRTVPESEYIIVPNTHEAIVDRDVWNSAQELMRTKYKSTSLKTSHVFAGIVKCKECGRGMTKVKRDRGETLICGSYKRLGTDVCSSHEVNMAELKHIVLDAINSHIKKLCDIKAAVSETTKFSKGIDELNIRIEQLKDKVDVLKQKKRGLYEDYKDNLITRAEYVEYNNSYADEVGRINNEITRLTEETKTSPLQEVNKQWFNGLVEYGCAQELTRELLMTFIDVIYVSEKNKKNIELEIVFNFSEKIDELEKSIS